MIPRRGSLLIAYPPNLNIPFPLPLPPLAAGKVGGRRGVAFVFY
jgi:hypothetical protein